ncbi:glycosyl transferase family 90-domain-containing protein [Aspergillus cavernicola]|uniref:Glycosyl transferase family 90-domain-containing protein n=1 Tax=Aspergillus cavernicola TaxID=176166 RepID=A0ABR4IKM0_9EURO
MIHPPSPKRPTINSAPTIPSSSAGFFACQPAVPRSTARAIMLPTVRQIRLWLMPLFQSAQGGIMDIIDTLRTGRWGQPSYQLLEGAREKSYYYYARTTKRTWIPACSAAARLCDHPISILAYDASQAFNKTLTRQSTSLDEAVTEYRRRYNMPPPPHFDKWFEFAQQRNTTLIDEYDTIYHSMLPFWGLSPSTIRSRVREDLGFDNRVMGISIRNGEPIHLGNGQGDFQPIATLKQFNKFAQFLPDMDLEFNIHDEPRVVVPHEELHRLVTKGYAAQASLNSNSSLLNYFPDKNTTAQPIPQVFTSRFNDFELQETWLYSRLSCPPDSPAMDLDGNAPDNTSAFAIEPLGFVFNQSASSDICSSPSLRHRLGIFERPNAFKLTNELVPMFSTSHLSSFQDIPVPSPWYYEEVGGYTPDTPVPWESRRGQIYWRGTTTGGHSRGGSWRNLQRQGVIASLERELGHHILERKNDSTCSIGGDEGWKVREANEGELSQYFNAHFVGILHCDRDCLEETMFFNVVDREDQAEAWNYRYLLDMDGHAYSGRFYAFMRSKSVPLKQAFFREWHEDMLIPWVHYVPLNKDVTDLPEIVRFFEQDPVGQQIARTIGEEGQSWAARTLRNDDMDVYMFRLMLEYARVQDDQRENLGFIPPSPPAESFPKDSY